MGEGSRLCFSEADGDEGTAIVETDAVDGLGVGNSAIDDVSLTRDQVDAPVG